MIEILLIYKYGVAFPWVQSNLTGQKVVSQTAPWVSHCCPTMSVVCCPTGGRPAGHTNRISQEHTCRFGAVCTQTPAKASGLHFCPSICLCFLNYFILHSHVYVGIYFLCIHNSKRVSVCTYSCAFPCLQNERCLRQQDPAQHGSQ